MLKEKKKEINSNSWIYNLSLTVPIYDWLYGASLAGLLLEVKSYNELVNVKVTSCVLWINFVTQSIVDSLVFDPI